MSITNQNSLQTSAVFACVRVLSESVASLPLVTYRRRPGGRGRDRATDHYLYPILHDLANPEMTAYELRETLMGYVATWGNGYSEIEFNRAGEVAALWPLRPDRMKVFRRNRRIWYLYEIPGGPKPFKELPFERVMHIRGLGFDGMVGYDPISLARQSIGLARGTEEFGARFFGNGAQTGAVYEHPGKLSDKAYNRLTRSIEKRHQGLENAHRIMILEEGMKANQVGIPPENAQFLETRKFQVSEIARWFRVPPHMIADLDRATFNNIEHQSLEFVIYTLMPWFVRWEQAIHRDLLTPRERLEYFAEHLVNALVRGDIKTRYEAYAIARQNGWLNADDIRDLENMNPLPNGQGQIYLVPLNMIPADQVGQVTSTDTGLDEGDRGFGPPSIPPDGGEERNAAYEARALNVVVARQRLARSWQRVFGEAIGRVVKREIVDVRRAIKKYLGKRNAQDLGLWLQEFYREHKDFWRKQMLPVLLAYADQVGVSVADELSGEPYSNEDIRQFIDDYVTALADREAGSSQLQLQALLDQALQDGQDPEPALTERLDEWEEKRTDKVTASESFSVLNACVVAYYGLAGVRRLIWRAVGKNCPYCRHLDGHVVEIEKFFIEKDTDFQPEGAERPLSKRHSVRHPPLHGGCDCCVTAGW